VHGLASFTAPTTASTRTFGQEIERSSELLWAYIYVQPFDSNPFLDPTGALCGQDQHGPVWFLPSIPGAALGNVVTRSSTIPRGKAVILQLMTALNDYPCPDPSFQQPRASRSTTSSSSLCRRPSTTRRRSRSPSTA
jgi:hypothetical protein